MTELVGGMLIGCGLMGLIFITLGAAYWRIANRGLLAKLDEKDAEIREQEETITRQREMLSEKTTALCNTINVLAGVQYQNAGAVETIERLTESLHKADEDRQRLIAELNTAYSRINEIDAENGRLRLSLEHEAVERLTRAGSPGELNKEKRK